MLDSGSTLPNTVPPTSPTITPPPTTPASAPITPAASIVYTRPETTPLTTPVTPPVSDVVEAPPETSMPVSPTQPIAPVLETNTAATPIAAPTSTVPTDPVVPPPDVPLAPPAPSTPPAPASAPSTSSWIQTIPKPLLVVGVVMLGLVLWGIWYRAAFYFRPAGPSGTKVSPLAPIQQIIPEDLSRYKSDGDSDAIPDFIEQELGLNPALNEVEACFTSSCDDASLQQGQIKQKNILLIVDGSGSMNLKLGTETKMDAAKRAVQNFVTQSGGSANIGLMTYGHKGSNSTADKPESCQSAEILAPIGTVTVTNIATQTQALRPVGWTPIGVSLQEAAAAFAGKEADINQIIVLTDGEETCNSNPVAAAQALANGPAKVTVNVIGFGITAAEQAGLQAISQAGKGTFASAGSAFELEDVFKKQWENYASVRTELNCKASSNTEGIACSGALYKKVSDYQLQNVLPKAGKSAEEKKLLSQMLLDFGNYRSKVMNQKTEEFAQRAKEQSGKLFK